jgi:hypothetical protein
MDYLTASRTPRLGKLLRTLIEYHADLALVPIGHPVRIRYKNAWRVIEEHPVLSSENLHTAIRGSFGEVVSHELDTQHKAFFELNGQRFFLRFLKDHTGGLLSIERLKPLPEPDHWPKAVHDWFTEGGFLEVEAEELYAAILKRWTQEKTGLAISLERTVKYPTATLLGLVEQREWKQDFENLEKGVNDALSVAPNLLAINRVFVTDDEKEKLKKLANTVPVLVCENGELAF